MDNENNNNKENEKSIGQSDLTNTLIQNVENAFIPDEVSNSIKENADDLENPKIDPENIDTDGVVFDADLHATDKEGNPSKTKTGKFRKKKGASKVATKDPQKVEAVVKRKQGLIMASNLAAGTFINVNCAIFGDEWLPEASEEYNEQEMLVRAFYDYMDAKEIEDFPPSVALAMALGSYSVRRLNKPTTKSRFQRLKETIIGKFLVWKGSRKNGAHVGTRKDGERKDDTNKTDSKPSEKAGRRGICS